MIKKKTLLVLGAGASMPYKFPSGEELWRRLCAMAQTAIPQDVLRIFGEVDCSLEDLQKFANTLRWSSVKSVDIFLAHRPTFEHVGKLAIAFQIARCEMVGNLYDTENVDDWYSHLWHRMREDVDSVTEIINNRLRIITFNYDRSLEHFLFHAIKNTFDTTDEVAQKTLGSLSIQHVYGLVGKFDNSGIGDGREYGPIDRGRRLEAAAAQIRTIPKTRDDEERFQILRKWFDWAEDVCFLGFSFDKQNVERLGFKSVLDWKRDHKLPIPPPRIFACVYRMTRNEANIALRLISPNEGWTSLDLPNLLFLRSLEVLE